MSLKNTHSAKALKTTNDYRRIKGDAKRLSNRTTRRASKRELA